MQERIYLLTGVAGFLGNNIAKQLINDGRKVRGLVLKGDKAEKYIPKGVDVVYGDLTDVESLKAFFDVEDEEIICIHCASIVYLKEEPSELVRRVNVEGTRNIINFCLSKKVKKLVYVSSTGTVADLPHGTMMKEPECFEFDKIVGYYGKTKAMATQLVMDAVTNEALPASIVYPTGICGPDDYAHGPVSTFTIQYCNGKTKIGVPGSFNSVDVRDLAAGIISCVDKGRIGEGYILGNEVVSMQEMFQYISDASGAKLVRTILPMPVTEIIVKIGTVIGKITHKDPLFTKLMLYNLSRNNAYDSSKARKELGYETRPFAETIHDEVMWLSKEGLISIKNDTSKYVSESVSI